jgi:hypothetical protein
MKQSKHPYNINHTNWVKSGLESFPPKFLLNSTVHSNWTAPHFRLPHLPLLWNLHVYQTIAPSHGTAKRSTTPTLTTFTRVNVGPHNPSTSFILKMMTEIYSETLKELQNRITHWRKQVAKRLSSKVPLPRNSEFVENVTDYVCLYCGPFSWYWGTTSFERTPWNNFYRKPQLLNCTCCQFCSHKRNSI